jgi:hypothetical protein
MRASGQRYGGSALALAISVLALSPPPAAAHVPDSNPITAQIYWANTGTDSIGRVSELDPADVDPSLIEGANDPQGITVEGAYLYWTNSGAKTIGRGNPDATGVDQSYVATEGTPIGITADDTYLYWTQVESGSGKIGRAQLDGFGASQAFIPTGAVPCGLGATPEWVFWSNGGASASLGRAGLAGGGPSQGFVAAAGDPCGLAVTRTHLYWANRAANSIGRARLDGSEANPTFIPMLADVPCGVAVDGGHVYWTTDGGSIGRARLDGSIDTQAFVTGASDPCGITLAPTTEATPKSRTYPDTEVASASGGRTFLVENTSSSALSISTLNMVGANPGDFKTASDGCTGTVPAGGACEIRVKFTPRREGNRQASLRISGNASNHPYLIALSGEGLPDSTSPRIRGVSARPLTARSRTTVRYRLSEPARVVLTIRSAVGGRRVGRATQAGRTGRNSKRIPAAGLAPGRYLVSLIATDRAGNESAARRTGFRVAR